MAYNLIKRTWSSWHRHHKTVQSINFALGLIFVISTLIFLVSGEGVGSNVSLSNVFLLGLCGVFSLWAGNTHNKKSVYVIDILLGLIFISSSAKTALYHDMTSRGDVILGVLIGLFYLILGYWSRYLWNRSSDKNNGIIEDFEP